MRPTFCLIAALAIVSAAAPVVAKPAHQGFEIKHTTWTMLDKKGMKMRESVDSDGNYVIETSAGKQVDHGTVMMKNAKACFASASAKGDHACWTTAPVSIGHSMKTTSDKGETITVTRVAYTPMKAQ